MRGIDLKVGDKLKFIKGGDVSWNKKIKEYGDAKTDYIEVVAEYPNCFLLEPHFKSRWENTSYRECINKADILAGEIKFEKVKE